MEEACNLNMDSENVYTGYIYSIIIYFNYHQVYTYGYITLTKYTHGYAGFIRRCYIMFHRARLIYLYTSTSDG